MFIYSFLGSAKILWPKQKKTKLIKPEQKTPNKPEQTPQNIKSQPKEPPKNPKKTNTKIKQTLFPLHFPICSTLMVPKRRERDSNFCYHHHCRAENKVAFCSVLLSMLYFTKAVEEIFCPRSHNWDRILGHRQNINFLPYCLSLIKVREILMFRWAVQLFSFAEALWIFLDAVFSLI